MNVIFVVLNNRCLCMKFKVVYARSLLMSVQTDCNPTDVIQIADCVNIIQLICVWVGEKENWRFTA